MQNITNAKIVWNGACKHRETYIFILRALLPEILTVVAVVDQKCSNVEYLQLTYIAQPFRFVIIGNF